jgi:hypothetical protein
MKGLMVFVLGAGASKPYGYPTAQELVERIAFQDPSDNSPLKGLEQFRLLKDNLATSKARSIDIFLGRDSQEDFKEVGKWAIAEKLIRCEQHGNVFGKTKGYKDNNRIGDDWYAYLFNTLTARCQTLDDVANLPVAFITFNYDRSLEYFLQQYLHSNFPGNRGREVEDLICHKLKITHVYGRLDLLGWEAKDGRNYKPDISPDIVKKASEGIRVLHEANEEQAFEMAHQWLAIAHTIWLLGFGYHPENMRRLRLPFPRLRLTNPDGSQQTHIFGTAFGMTDPERDAVKAMNLDYAAFWALGDKGHMITDALRNNSLFLSLVR